MTSSLRVASSDEFGSTDPELGHLIDELTSKLQRGETVDHDSILAANPRHAEALRRLLPALAMLAEIGRTVVPSGVSLHPNLTPLTAGGQFGRFRIMRELGRGGMGAVYEAVQPQVNRPVALKVILSGEFASVADLLRFQAEAEAASRLDHPNIVPIHEVGDVGGRPYFTMKLCPGGSLDDIINDRQDDPRRAATIAAKVARAVSHAHRRGILHRDLKPSNILLDAQGEPMVADFGLARLIDASHSLTLSNAVLGSPPYMAPEQARAGRGDPTTATDVYGVGAVLYALLSGRPPFRAETVPDTLDQVRNRAPDPPGRGDRPLSRDLKTVCLKCLEKDPRQRYGSADELADDLDRWLRGEPIHARPSSLGHRLALWSRRPERIRDAGRLALTLGVLLTLYASSGLMLLAVGTLKPPSPEAFAIFLLKFVTLGYGPLAILGWATLRGYRAAIWLGLAHAIGIFSVFMGHVFGLFRVAGYNYQDRMMMAAYDLFFCSLIVSIISLYLIAVIADRSRPPSRPVSASPA